MPRKCDSTNKIQTLQNGKNSASNHLCIGIHFHKTLSDGLGLRALVTNSVENVPLRRMKACSFFIFGIEKIQGGMFKKP